MAERYLPNERYSLTEISQLLGFAAPSNIVRAVTTQIRSHGRVNRGAIGVVAQTITPTLAAGLKLPQAWGVILSDVHPRSPAAAAGLLAGDIVLTLDGKTMENSRQFDVNLYRRAAGDSATITVLREGQRFTRRVPVIAREDDPARIAETDEGTLGLAIRSSGTYRVKARRLRAFAQWFTGRGAEIEKIQRTDTAHEWEHVKRRLESHLQRRS